VTKISNFLSYWDNKNQISGRSRVAKMRNLVETPNLWNAVWTFLFFLQMQRRISFFIFIYFLVTLRMRNIYPIWIRSVENQTFVATPLKPPIKPCWNPKRTFLFLWQSRIRISFLFQIFLSILESQIFIPLRFVRPKIKHSWKLFRNLKWNLVETINETPNELSNFGTQK
jgi:hypothetical protein